MDPRKHKKLAQKIFQKAHLKGDFQLRSGEVSQEYFDKYQVEADPQLLEEVSRALVPLIPQDTDILAGLELGGVPLATTLSLMTQKPLCFVRKQAKEYGTCKIAEGFDIEKKNLCLIEDVITTGGQVIESAKILRDKKAHVQHVLCLILREQKALERLKEHDLNLHFLFKKEDFF